MKKKLPAILIGIACIVLLALYIGMSGRSGESAGKQVQPGEITAETAPPASPEPEDSFGFAIPVDEPELAEDSIRDERKEAVQRIMQNISRLIEDPDINSALAAAQRAMMSAEYADLIDFLNLTEEEEAYFMDLLAYRRSAQVSFALKGLAGNLTPEERAAMRAEMDEVNEAVRSEMERFLNNPDDFAEYEYYEDTQTERQLLSRLDRELQGSDAAMSDETYRNLLGLMHDERSQFPFTTDLADTDNLEMDLDQLSPENLQMLSSDLRQLNESIVNRASEVLTPVQLDAFRKSMDTSLQRQTRQIEMAARFFGGE